MGQEETTFHLIYDQQPGDTGVVLTGRDPSGMSYGVAHGATLEEALTGLRAGAEAVMGAMGEGGEFPLAILARGRLENPQANFTSEELIPVVRRFLHLTKTRPTPRQIPQPWLAQLPVGVNETSVKRTQARKTQARLDDVAVFLKTEEDRTALLDVAREDGHPDVISAARAAIARSRDIHPSHDEARMTGALKAAAELLTPFGWEQDKARLAQLTPVDQAAILEIISVPPTPSPRLEAAKAHLHALLGGSQEVKEGRAKAWKGGQEGRSARKPGPVPKTTHLKGTGPTAADQVLTDQEAPTNEPANPRTPILAFREEIRERYGLENPSLPAGIEHMLGLAEARLHVLALLLEAEPKKVKALLDKLVWQADLSEAALSAARAEAGLPNPVWSCLNSDRKAYTTTLTEGLAMGMFVPPVTEQPSQNAPERDVEPDEGDGGALL